MVKICSMSTLARKKREFAQREELILETARRLLLEVGYLELTMDLIAKEIEYSKGTIYQHFSSKEEILLALALQFTRKEGEFFQRAATFQGKSRERVVALAEAYELFVRLYPHHFKTELLILNESIRAKGSRELRRQLEACEQQNMSIVSGVVRDGLAQGDFVGVPGISPEEIVFGIWTGAFGAFVLMSSDTPLTALGIQDPMKALKFSMHALLDGFGWRPYFSEWDYEKTSERVKREIFSKEMN